MIYHVSANRKNVGDWLAARAIQRLLRVPVVELFCDEPFVADTMHRLSTAGSRDLVILGGGGLFMDYFGPFWAKFERISRVVPFCLWGVGCCDMKREKTTPDVALLKRIVGRSRLCIVRDGLTRDLLAGCHIPDPIPCPSLTAIRRRRPGHGVLHVDCLDNVGQRTYDTMNAAAQRFSRNTRRPFRRINNQVRAGDRSALSSVLRDYSNADLILTGRLHGCILGLAMGRRVLAVSGDRKIESFMRAAALQDWVVDMQDRDRIAARLRALEDQPAPLRFLADARRSNRAVADTVRAIAASVERTGASIAPGRA